MFELIEKTEIIPNSPLGRLMLDKSFIDNERVSPSFDAEELFETINTGRVFATKSLSRAFQYDSKTGKYKELRIAEVA